MDTKDTVQEQFGAAARNYAESWPHSTGPDLAAVLETLEADEPAAALDVGCGAGHTAFALASVARRVVGLDLTPAMLEETRSGASSRGLDRVTVQAGDAEQMPFPDEHFDVVTSRLAAHHFPRIERFVEEAFRVLRPGGKLIVSDTISPDDDVQDTYGNAIELLRDPSHARNRRVPEWRQRFEQAGFTDLQERGRFPCPLDFEVWTTRMKTPRAAREGIQALFRSAPREVVRAFRIDPEGRSWQLEIAVLSASKPSAYAV